MVEEQTPNTPQTPIEHTVENPMTPEKKVNWMKIVVGIFFGAVLLIIGLLLGRGSIDTESEEITIAPEPTKLIVQQPTQIAQPTLPSQDPTAIIMQDEIAGWETYQYIENSLEFKYPPQYVVSKRTGAGESSTILADVMHDKLTNSSNYIEISTIKKDLDIPLAEWVKERGPESSTGKVFFPSAREISTTQVNNIPAAQFTDTLVGWQTDTTNIAVEINGSITIFTNVGIGEFDEILSTLELK